MDQGVPDLVQVDVRPGVEDRLHQGARIVCAREEVLGEEVKVLVAHGDAPVEIVEGVGFAALGEDRLEYRR